MTAAAEGVRETDEARESGGVLRARAARWSDAAFAVGLFAVAFAARWVAARHLAAEPVWDGQYYDFGARRIAAGFGYSDERTAFGQTVWHPWCHYPVGYSAYLGAFYKVFGSTAFAAHLADAFAGSLLAVVTFLLAREALSPRRARIAGAIVALHPGLILYGALVMTEPLASLLTLAAFWIALRVQRRRGERGVGAMPAAVAARLRRIAAPLAGPIAGALVLGVGALVRPQALLCAPFLAVAANVRSLRGRAAAAAVACAVTLATIAPWTLRNCRVMDGCALVSTNAGWNLAIGAFPRATGRFETLRSSDGCREVTGQVQQDRCWFSYGLDNIRREPMRWLGLVPAKLGYTFDHESFAVEYLHEARPASWPEPRRTEARELVTFVHRLLVVLAPLAFVGFVRVRRKDLTSRRDAAVLRAAGVQLALALAIAVAAYLAFSAGTPTFWPIVVGTCLLPWLPLPGRPSVPPAITLGLVLLGTTVLTHAVFFGEDRYHVVVTPVLALFAAAAFRPPRATARAHASTDLDGLPRGDDANAAPARTPFAA